MRRQCSFESHFSPAVNVELKAAGEIRIPFGLGIAGYVAQTKEVVNLADAYMVSRHVIRIQILRVKSIPLSVVCLNATVALQTMKDGTLCCVVTQSLNSNAFVLHCITTQRNIT